MFQFILKKNQVSFIFVWLQILVDDNQLNTRAYDACEATGMCHHTTYKYNPTDSTVTYLVGLSRHFSKFEYILFSFFEITPSITGCRFLLERPSHFVGNSNSLTKFNLNREIEPYTTLIVLNKVNFSFGMVKNSKY